MKTIRIRNGLDVGLSGNPRQTIGPARPVQSVCLFGDDYPGLTLKPLVETGTRLGQGEPVLVDRARPDIVVPTPVAGLVRTIILGPRRRFQTMIIEIDSEQVSTGLPDVPGGQEVRVLLQRTGLWTAFRSRPFGAIPDPGAIPDAIFVTAIDTNPLAVDSRIAIDGMKSSFMQGVEACTKLTEGPVFVCEAPGPPLLDRDLPRVRTVCFEGRHPAGLPSTHIHHLASAGDRSVWHINWQEIAAIGALLTRGELSNERIVAIGGPGAKDPRLVRAVIGANVEDLTANELNDGPYRIVSGSPLHGRTSGFLGRFDTQIAVLEAGRPDSSLPFLSRLLGIRPRTPPSIIPLPVLDRAEIAGVPVIPLLRALSARDAEGAVALGCLQLVEEDLALASYLCSSRANYGDLLRAVLDELASEA